MLQHPTNVASMEYIFNLQETQMQKTQKKRSLMMKQGK
jgi:hypothetical protein